jgi:GTP cyclohydrolase I
MNLREPLNATAMMPDVQSSVDHRNLSIDDVGIRSIRYPMRVADREGEPVPTVAVCNMYVELPEHVKGTHMSRFIELLQAWKEPVSVASIEGLLDDMCERLLSNAGRIEFSFPFFRNKAAPVSGVESLLDYEVSLIGELRAGVFTRKLRVVVPVTSLCPCSKRISAYGAHNQRSHVTVTVCSGAPVWISEIIDIVESQASAELFGILKRADEKFVTEQAYDNPKFVEDTVRDVSALLEADARVERYVVEAENFESIHNHSAYAMIKGPKHR